MLARGRSETGGLDYELHLNETANIDISDRLINGQIDTVVKIDVNPNTVNIRQYYLLRLMIIKQDKT